MGCDAVSEPRSGSRMLGQKKHQQDWYYDNQGSGAQCPQRRASLRLLPIVLPGSHAPQSTPESHCIDDDGHHQSGDQGNQSGLLLCEKTRCSDQLASEHGDDEREYDDACQKSQRNQAHKSAAKRLAFPERRATSHWSFCVRRNGRHSILLTNPSALCRSSIRAEHCRIKSDHTTNVLLRPSVVGLRVIGAAVDEEKRPWRKLCHHIYRANVIEVHTVDGTCCQQRARSEKRWEMPLLWNFTLQDGKVIGSDRVRHNGAYGRLMRCCQDERGATHRETPSSNHTGTTQCWIGKCASAQEINGAQHIALLKVTKGSRCWWRFPIAAHIEGEDSEATSSEGPAELEQSDALIGPVGGIAMHHNDRALSRQAAVWENAGDKPPLQLEMIFPAREGDILVL